MTRANIDDSAYTKNVTSFCELSTKPMSEIHTREAIRQHVLKSVDITVALQSCAILTVVAFLRIFMYFTYFTYLCIFKTTPNYGTENTAIFATSGALLALFVSEILAFVQCPQTAQ